MNNLKEGELLVWVDFKNKVLPQKSIEDAMDFFGKVGMSLLGCQIFSRLNQELQSRFLDLVLDENSQDNLTVQSCLYFIVKFLAQNIQGVRKISFVSDNAAVFNSSELIPFIRCMNSKYWNTEINVVVDCTY